MKNWDPADWIAFGGVLVALAGYFFHHHQARRERKMRAFADALGAIAEYQELPYRVRRRQASDAATRATIAERVSDIQVKVAFHLAWLEIESEAVAAAYRTLVAAARRESGAHMSAAWAEPVLADDPTMNLGTGYVSPETDEARAECLRRMRAHLAPVRRLRHG
jgi:hypothetical protein